MSIFLRHMTDAAKRVFFLAMNDGYVNEKPKKSKIVQLPGSRLITFEHDEVDSHFVLNDLYFVTKRSDYSHGVTTISCDGEPVWMMSYEGRYPKDSIKLLKTALKCSYSKNRFIGGRGPCSLKVQKGIFYYNDVISGDFSNFSGSERMVDNEKGVVVGWHNYRGLLMI